MAELAALRSRMEAEMGNLAAEMDGLSVEVAEVEVEQEVEEEEEVEVELEETPLLDSFDLEAVAEGIRSGRFRKVICMIGAGVSVAAGIPDFRTPGKRAACGCACARV